MVINQVTIRVTDLDKAVTFYKTLGLQLIVYTENKYARFITGGNSTTFSLEVADKVVPGTMEIYFEVEDLDNKVQQLEGQGIVFDLHPTDMQWLWREAKLRDPDGNRLIIYYAGENRLNPPWRIK